MSSFKGFSQQGLNFLQMVTIQNSKAWFDENRAIYDRELVLPFKQLVETLAPSMLKIDAWFETKPAIGKTVSRIHRDTRFSHDKSLYRGRLWLTFKRPSKDWKASPAYFFEISTDSYRYGLGYYCAEKSTMDVFRAEIKNNPSEFLKAAKCCKKPFTLVGESYKRPLLKDLDPALANWYNRKSFAILAEKQQVDDLFKPELANNLAKSFQQLSPLYDYLMRVEMIKTIPNL